MRIISGKYGNRNLKTPAGDKIHPMGERIRNAIFNKLGARVVDVRVLDAFAGSGAVGIEALSRGAKSCVFVEKNRQVASILTQNLNTLGIENGRLVPATVLQFLETNDQQFDLIFADPPYHDTQDASVIALASVLAPGGQLILSNPKSAPALHIPSLELTDERTYADAKISFYQKTTDN